jgi:hypothetical protein
MATLKVVSGGILDKVKNLQSLSKTNNAEVGWFAVDGDHPTAEMTYPELAHYHATGSNNVPVRDVLEITKGIYQAGKYPKLKATLTRYLDTGNGYEAFLEALGESFWMGSHTVIGHSPPLVLGSNPTPLVDTGELRDHLSYRTTKDLTLKR